MSLYAGPKAKANNSSLLPHASGRFSRQTQPPTANPFLNRAPEAAPPRHPKGGGGGGRGGEEKQPWLVLWGFRDSLLLCVFFYVLKYAHMQVVVNFFSR